MAFTPQQLNDILVIYESQNLSPIFSLYDFIDRELTLEELNQIGNMEYLGRNFFTMHIIVPLIEKVYVRTRLMSDGNNGWLQTWCEFPLAPKTN